MPWLLAYLSYLDLLLLIICFNLYLAVAFHRGGTPSHRAFENYSVENTLSTIFVLNECFEKH